MSTLNNDYTGHWSIARQDPDPLPFMKLDPKRMLPPGADFTQPQVAVVRDLSNRKSGTIESTGDYASRAATAFAQHEIAQCITFPTGHCLKNFVGCEVLATGRSVERNPTGESLGNIGRSAILSVRVGSRDEDQQNKYKTRETCAHVKSSSRKGATRSAWRL